MTNRRQFIKQSAFISTLLSIDPMHLYANPERIRSEDVLRERIVPVSLIWDVTNLMTKDKNISWKMVESISEQFSMVVCGKVLEKGKKFIPELLDITKAGSGWDNKTHPKVAIMVGWLIYNEVVPVITSLYQNDNDMASILRDATVLKHKIQQESNLNVSKEELSDILKLMFHRAFFRTHTLTPDKQNWESWVVNYIDWYHRDRQNMEQLADGWDTQNVNETEFFNPQDEIIQLANDYSQWEIDLKAEFLQNKGESSYAKALTKATLAVKMLDDFFDDKISKDTLMKRLNIA